MDSTRGEGERQSEGWVQARRMAKADRLLAVNEGFHAVLPVSCDAARAPHCTAQAACRVVESMLNLRCQENPKEGMRGEMVVSEVAIDDGSEAWSVLLGSARPLLAATAGRRWSLKTHLAGLERNGEQLTQIEGAGSPHHPGSGGGAPRLARWRAPDRWAGEAAKAGFSRVAYCAV